MNKIIYSNQNVLNVDDLAKELRIGKCTAYKLVRSGKIRSVRVNRQYRIPRTALDEFLNAGAIGTPLDSSGEKSVWQEGEQRCRT